MRTEMLWIKEQIKDKRFRILLAVGVLVEILLSAEFILFSYSPLKIIRYIILLSAMFIIAWIDQCDRRIPNDILLVLSAVRIVLWIVECFVFKGIGLALLFSSLLGMIFGGGLFLLAHFLSKGGVGMGDVKLFAVIGTYVGGGSIMTVVFLTAAVSAVYSIIMLALKKIKLKEEIPFAPFALTGVILTMALGM